MQSNINFKYILIFLILFFFALLIRLYKADEPFGGYHSFNEGWYTTLAENYKSHSILNPVSVYNKLDFNVPPFLSYLLHISFIIMGENELSARIVPILFSAFSLFIIFLLGEFMFSVSTSLIAVAIAAFCPVYVLIGRNVQTDAVYLCFLLTALLFYLKTKTEQNNQESRTKNANYQITKLSNHQILYSIFAGLFFGLALFTKQFAVLIIPSIIIWELLTNRNLKWINKHLFTLLGIAALIFFPFYIYHGIVNSKALFGAQKTLSDSQFVAPEFASFVYFFEESYRAFSPPFFWLAVLGIVAAAIRRDKWDTLLLSMIFVFCIFFTLWHGHSYYIVYLVPFLSLLIAKLLEYIKSFWFKITLVTVVTIYCTISSIVLLCNVKYGYSEFKNLGSLLASIEGHKTLIISGGVKGSYYPALYLYCKGTNTQILTLSEVLNNKSKIADSRTFFAHLYGLPYKTHSEHAANIAQKQNLGKKLFITRDNYGLVLFGYQIYQIINSEFFFKGTGLKLNKVTNARDFAIRKIGKSPSLVLIKIPININIFSLLEQSIDKKNLESEEY